MKKFKPVFIFTWLILIFSFAVQAQTGTTVAKTQSATALVARELKLESKLMSRQMPYHLILPNGYDEAANKTKKYPVIYLLHGLTGHYNNWAEKTKLAEYAMKYQYIIAMPDRKSVV